MPKTINNRYEIKASIGEGGMSDVYLAYDTILNREVAIKILRGELGSDPIALLRFQREANAVSKVLHPNVVDLYDVGEWNGRHYIVMEYVRGRTLKQLIQQRGALEKTEAIDIMTQIASGLEEAHKNKIIHRDIKPQNILVKDDGTVKITDFGIALANDVVQLTSNDAVLGSAHYLAPEVTKGEMASIQSDIYSLGVVFYELLTGSVPFTGDNVVNIAMKHLHEEIPSVLEVNPSLPQSIDNIVRRSTVKNKMYRYKSVQEMLDDLALCLTKEHRDDAPVVFGDTFGSSTTVILSQQELKEDIIKSQQEKEINDKKEKRMRSILVVFLVVFGISIITATLYAIGVIPQDIFVDTIEMPDLTGMNQTEAQELLIEHGIDPSQITVKTQMSDDVERNVIISFTPEKGEKIKVNKEINLVVSEGTYFVIGNYVDSNIENIRSVLEDQGIIVEVEQRATSSVRVGTILEQSILSEGEKINPSEKNRIKFIVAASPSFQMPNVVGMDVETARVFLEEKGAIVTSELKSKDGLSEDELKKIKTGVVIETSIPYGTMYVQEGSNRIILYTYSE